MTGRTAAEAYELAMKARDTIQSHEDICTLRHSTINDKLDDAKAGINEIKGWVKTGVCGVAAIAVTLGGFMAHELYTNLQHPAAQVGATR